VGRAWGSVEADAADASPSDDADVAMGRKLMRPTLPASTARRWSFASEDSGFNPNSATYSDQNSVKSPSTSLSCIVSTDAVTDVSVTAADELDNDDSINDDDDEKETNAAADDDDEDDADADAVVTSCDAASWAWTPSVTRTGSAGAGGCGNMYWHTFHNG
jgi:hypothetical protein